MPDSENQFLTLRSGRRLCYAEYGDPAGEPLMYFHGWPSSRLQARLLHESARELGLRIVAPDRPGIGNSDPQPGRHLRDWPPILEEVAAQLGFERFLVMGVSGGGPYAIAAASMLPERVRAASVICGAPPLDEFPDRSALMFPYRVLLKLRPAAPVVMKALLPFCRWVTSKKPDEAPLKWFFRWVSPVDRAALETHEDLQVVIGSFTESLNQGGMPLIHDADIYLDEWRIDYGDITTPIEFWHGGLDHNLPIAMAREIASRIPHAKGHWLDAEGHYSLPINHTRDIVTSLMALGRH